MRRFIPGLVKFAVIALMAVTLAGCGHRYAVMRDNQGADVMLLGHDPVAYFTVGKPMRGYPNIREDYDGVTFYFTSEENRAMFRANPAKYFPQYGAFCSSGAAYGIKLGHDPTEFEIVDGKIYFFGDILGHEVWKNDPVWNIKHGDQMWTEAKDTGWRFQSLYRYMNKVDWYKNSKVTFDEWHLKNPGRTWPDFDPGGMITNLFLKEQGWRAREGYFQPKVGFVGVDPCPVACPGEVSKKFGEK
ncbi:MAG: YHS domain-containing (seleno)protein [Burkholderiales bacterium]